MKVLIVPDSPRENWLSMALYAREVEACTRHFERVSASTLVYPQARRGPLAAAFDRYLTAPRLTRRSSFDVAHILDHAYAHLVYSLEGRPGVVTCHDLTALEMRIDSPTVALFRIWGAPALRRADRVLAISQATKANLMLHLGIVEAAIDIVPYGIDEAYKSVTWVADRGPLKLLHVGSNHRYKRVEIAIATAVELSRRGKAVEFWKVGPSLQCPQLRTLESGGVKARMLGSLNTLALARVYATASLLLFPSSHEGFGRPVAEATAIGLPTVISAIPPLAEASGGFGLQVAGSDPRLFADACIQAWEMPDREALAAGRSWAAGLSWERHGRELERVYEEVARR